MIYATLFVCSLAGVAPCKSVVIPLGYLDEAACFKGGWVEASHYEKHEHGWKIEGIGCSPTPPTPLIIEKE